MKLTIEENQYVNDAIDELIIEHAPLETRALAQRLAERLRMDEQSGNRFIADLLDEAQVVGLMVRCRKRLQLTGRSTTDDAGNEIEIPERLPVRYERTDGSTYVQLELVTEWGLNEVRGYLEFIRKTFATWGAKLALWERVEQHVEENGCNLGQAMDALHFTSDDLELPEAA